MKILLIANTGWYLHNFRSGLVCQLRELGATVIAVCPHDEYVPALERMGVRWVEWRLHRSGTNPVAEIRALLELVRIYRRERPEVVHHFTIKPILYGALATKCGPVGQVVNSVTGLGHAFVSHRLAMRLIRPWLRTWYTWALTTGATRAIFQNPDDLTLLARNTLQLWERCRMTAGSGVDLRRFHPADDGAERVESRRQVLFVGRLIAEKGITEFLEAARICHNRGLSADFFVCGNPDPQNPSSIPAKQIAKWQAEGWVTFLGHVEPIDERLQAADLIVLPSRREGTPRVLLEAAAMGKAIVATDVPGCRQVVDDGLNGRLVPPGQPEQLAAAIEELLDDDGLRRRMGVASRARAVAEFDEEHIIEQTIGTYHLPMPAQKRHISSRQYDRSPSLQRGIFTLSLDFELAWGTRGRPNAGAMAPFLSGTREAVRGLVDLLERYDIAATWAIVGGLMMGHSGGQCRHRLLAGREFDDVPLGDATSQPFWYAEDLLEEILACPVAQEMACHTLTHAVVDPSPEGREPFRRDLAAFLELFEELHLPRPRAFIFPRGRMGHFDVLAEMGFRSIRGPESKWFESLPGEVASAACRLLDARLGCRPRVDEPWSLLNQTWVIPSSQFYSPFQSVGKRVSVAARVKKALKGLHAAEQTKSVFHIWTHPFNLGLGTEELLAGLESILQEAARLRDAGRLEVLSMSAIADRLDKDASREDISSREATLPAGFEPASQPNTVLGRPG